MADKIRGIHVLLDTETIQFLEDLRGDLRPIPSRTGLVVMLLKLCKSQDRDSLLTALSTMAQQSE